MSRHIPRGIGDPGQKGAPTVAAPKQRGNAQPNRRRRRFLTREEGRCVPTDALDIAHAAIRSSPSCLLPSSIASSGAVHAPRAPRRPRRKANAHPVPAPPARPRVPFRVPRATRALRRPCWHDKVETRLAGLEGAQQKLVVRSRELTIRANELEHAIAGLVRIVASGSLAILGCGVLSTAKIVVGPDRRRESFPIQDPLRLLERLGADHGLVREHRAPPSQPCWQPSDERCTASR